MSEQFRGPAFLRQEIKPGPLKEDEYGEGAFTVVANLENLPEDVCAKVPKGYVVKEYKNERLNPSDVLFRLDPDSNAVEDHALKAWSLPGMAKKLQARQRKVQEYFGKELPNFVVPSQFIVGTDERGTGHIYEIQEKMEAKRLEIGKSFFTRVENDEAEAARICDIDELAEQMQIKYGEQINQVKRELDIFIRLAEPLLDSQGWFTDLSPGNLVFTKDGLRFIDTNYLAPLRELEQRGKMDHVQAIREKIQRYLRSLKDLSARL